MTNDPVVAATPRKKSWLPTRKWFATQVTALTALAVAFAELGHWNTTLSISAIGLVSQAALGYILPNADTPGGVPTKES